MSEIRQLFGGAITAEFPVGFLDASELRQIPDNQEVLIRNDSDVSCIVEVLQLATEEGAGDGLDGAIRFHFGSLAHDNSASSFSIESVIKKFGKASEPDDLVRIRLALWRLESKKIDLVMSFNEPLGKVGEASQVTSEEIDSAFEQAAKNLRIRDWSLFA